MANVNGGSKDGKVGGARGPAYPYIPLGRAVERTQVIADKGAGRQPMPPESFYALWGIGAKSSSARQTIAALGYYGLVEHVGRGNDRRAKLSELARRIVFDQREGSLDRATALRQAALEPPIFRELYDRYGPVLPADTAFHSYLMMERSFTKQGAEACTDNYKSTFEYAGLAEPEKMPAARDSNGGGNEVEYGGARAGDLIDYEAGGAIANREPLRVRALSPDQAWVFVEDSETGLEMDQVIVRERSQGERQQPDRPTLPLGGKSQEEEPKAGTRRAIFPLDDGDVTLTFPEGLSAEALTDLDDYLKIFLNKERAKAAKLS